MLCRISRNRLYRFHYNRQRSNPLPIGDPVGIHTQDLQNRNLTLYSAKLRDLYRLQKYKNKLKRQK